LKTKEIPKLIADFKKQNETKESVGAKWNHLKN
jgi:hypothetical protein